VPLGFTGGGAIGRLARAGDGAGLRSIAQGRCRGNGAVLEVGWRDSAQLLDPAPNPDLKKIGDGYAVIQDLTVGGSLAKLLTGQNLKLPRTARLQVTGSFCISLASKLRTYTVR
jgi:hypothetical protein